MTAPVLRVSGLGVAFGGRTVLRDVSFTVMRGEHVGITGPSGAGKSTLGAALLRLLPTGAALATGARIEVEGEDLVPLDAESLRSRRGRIVGIAFQEPLLALTPTMTVGALLTEGLEVHGIAHGAEAMAKARAMLDRVGVDGAAALGRYPHEFSGGMRQRILLAGSMLLEPSVLVADEPTTALDATVQRQVLDLMDELCAERGTALLHISHDLAVLGERCTRILELRDGALAPRAMPEPRPLASLPRHAPPLADGPREEPHDGLVVRDLDVTYAMRHGLGAPEIIEAVQGISFDVPPGTALGLIGESGAGKSSVAQAIVGMTPYGGSILFGDAEVGEMDERALRRHRGRVRLVPQDAGASLTPHLSCAQLVVEGALVHRRADLATAQSRAAALFDQLGLPASALAARPRELSAGQRQRVAIARALITDPALLVADEPVASLDPESRERVLALFDALMREHHMSLLLVTHDLAGVMRITDACCVMKRGKVMESGRTAAVLLEPANAYTMELVGSVPSGSPRRR